MATKNEIGILFYFVKFFDFSSVKNSREKNRQTLGKKNNQKNFKRKEKKKTPDL
jgi:hypothetical protein